LHDVELAVSGPTLPVEPEGRPIADVPARTRQIDPRLEVAVGLFEMAVALHHAADHVERLAVAGSHGLVVGCEMRIAAADAHLGRIVSGLLRGVYRFRYGSGGAEPICAPVAGIETVELVIKGQCPGRIDR